jgi:hypothetical protein
MGLAILFLEASSIDDQMWSPNAVIMAIRTIQRRGPRFFNPSAYALIFSGPANIKRLPSICPIKNPMMSRPVMAITIFVKTVDRRNCSNDDMDAYPYNAVMVYIISKSEAKLWIYRLFIKKRHVLIA